MIKFIKIFDIGFVTIIYIFTSLFFARLTDMFFGKFDEKREKKKSVFVLTLEIMLLMWLFGILVYVVRNVTRRIPFPLDGYYGFKYSEQKEVNSAYVFTFTYMIFCKYFKEKLLYYYSNVIVFSKVKKNIQ
jgi:hypothetical protein